MRVLESGISHQPRLGRCSSCQTYHERSTDRIHVDQKRLRIADLDASNNNIQLYTWMNNNDDCIDLCHLFLALSVCNETCNRPKILMQSALH